jgi:thiosulfate reductase cytochrome b subunit
MLSDELCADMALLGAMLLLPIVDWAKAAGAHRLRAQAAAMIKRDIGIVSCCGWAGMIPVKPVWLSLAPGGQCRLRMDLMPCRAEHSRRRLTIGFLGIVSLATNMRDTTKRVIHPWWLRLTHWLNAFAIVMMIGSGWQIYNASPLFGFTFPIGIGQWLGAGIAWHLAMMWLLVGNGLIYFIASAASGHWRKLVPLRPRAVAHDIGAALTFRLKHEKGVYNAVQRLLYCGVLFAGVVIVLSGLAIWKPIQLWPLCDLCGGYYAARYVHFFAMAAIAAFVVVHLVLVAMVPKVLPPMITGGKI